MHTLADRLKKARLDAGHLTAGDAANALGWNEHTYRANENGTRQPGRTALVAYATGFGVSLEWLLTGRGDMRQAQAGGGLRQVPILSWEDISTSSIPLRKLLLSAEARGYVTVPDDARLSTNTFGLVVAGEAMISLQGSPLSLHPGDVAILDPDRIPRPGNIALARLHGGAMLRKLKVLEEASDGRPVRVSLVPLNDYYPAHEAPGEAVVATMVGLYRSTV